MTNFFNINLFMVFRYITERKSQSTNAPRKNRSYYQRNIGRIIG